MWMRTARGPIIGLVDVGIDRTNVNAGQVMTGVLVSARYNAILGTSSKLCSDRSVCFEGLVSFS